MKRLVSLGAGGELDRGHNPGAPATCRLSNGLSTASMRAAFKGTDYLRP
ncbi:MAG: hypothetical protein HOP16_19820 [Acidobacteria bacterium]|nr:hypothetical protein [Acidobacteriota bacterium]